MRGVVISCLILGLALIGVSTFSLYKWYNVYDKETDATIINVEHKSEIVRRNRRTRHEDRYKADYTFMSDSGKEVTSSTGWTDIKYVEGDKVAVRYLSDDPGDNMLGGDNKFNLWLLLVLGILALVFAGVVKWIVRK